MLIVTSCKSDCQVAKKKRLLFFFLEKKLKSKNAKKPPWITIINKVSCLIAFITAKCGDFKIKFVSPSCPCKWWSDISEGSNQIWSCYLVVHLLQSRDRQVPVPKRDWVPMSSGSAISNLVHTMLSFCAVGLRSCQRHSDVLHRLHLGARWKECARSLCVVLSAYAEELVVSVRINPIQPCSVRSGSVHCGLEIPFQVQ